MNNVSTSLRTHFLKGYRPTVVRSEAEAFAVAERMFSKLAGFEFSSDGGNRLITSGPQHDGLAIKLVGSTGHRISIGDDDKVSILFPFAGIIQVERARQTETARPSQLLIVQPGRRDTILGRGYLGILVQIPWSSAERMRRSWRELTGQNDYAAALIRIDRASAVASAHLVIERLERQQPCEDNPDCWRTLVTGLWDGLAMALDDRTEAEPPPASFEQVRRAESYMAAHCKEIFHIGAVARAVDVGPRSLQLAFRRHRRRSPLQFLQDCRLHLVRSKLADGRPGTSVTSTAVDCGFSHLGRFSEAYRRAFGERPSQTLRRARLEPT